MTMVMIVKGVTVPSLHDKFVQVKWSVRAIAVGSGVLFSGNPMSWESGGGAVKTGPDSGG